MSNPSTVYANIFVESLLDAGLRHVCLVPGSRHTPLVLAFANHQDRVKVYSHLDERSASFFALGLALALDEPVAVVCTSGTAGANFYPAIIEAHQSRIPLIILTADRPHELRQSGANQTIDQVKMFGDFVLWFYDAPLPEADPSQVAIRNLQSLASRTVATANGSRKGVVHINLPFRKPLEPTTGESLSLPVRTGIPTVYTTPQFVVDGSALDELQTVVQTHENGIILCGGGLTPAYAQAIVAVSERIGYPILAESYSHARHPYQMSGGYDFYASKLDKPDVILRFGDVPIANSLNQLIASSGAKYIYHFDRGGVWADDSHLTTHDLPLSSSVIDALNAVDRPQPARLSRYRQLEQATWQAVDKAIQTTDYFDGGVVYDVVDLIPDNSVLFAGNSLPIRHLDQFGKPTHKYILTYANRGASGIDGNISTALGTGAGHPDKPLVAIFGDITFYHDMNGLLAVHRCGVPITIVLLNNDGGGIFHRLPIREHDPHFTDYFLTAHGLDYSHSAKLYGLDYVCAESREQFRAAFEQSVTTQTSTIIEVRTDAQADLQRRQAVMSAVNAALQEINL